MADKTSDTGLWLTEDGKVVTERPRGAATQLVRPGGRVTSAVQARIDSLSADPDAPAVSAAAALGNPEPGEPVTSEPDAVSTDDVQARPARKAAKKS